MENFSTLSASVSGASVILSWTLPGEAASAAAVLVQRADFGRAQAWVTIHTVTPPTATYTDAPGTGSFSYRLIAVAGSPLTSNVVDVTTEAATGEVILSADVVDTNADVAGPTGHRYAVLEWDFGSQDAQSYTVQRSLDAGVTWRNISTTSQLTYVEMLATGTGAVSYRVIANLPNIGAGDQLNRSVPSTSNAVALTL